MLKSTFLQDYLFIALALAIVISSLLTLTGIPFLAIGGGFILSVILPRIFYNKKWNNLEFETYPSWKRYGIAAIPSIIGSQIGWAALLI